MKYNLLKMSFMAFLLIACNRQHQETDSHDAHEGEKIQYIVYGNDYELFAEADPFIAGEPANILGHFSTLANFKPVESGKITAILSVNGSEIVQTLDKPTRKGIYSIDINPETPGKGFLKFILSNENGNAELIVPDVTVYASRGEIHETAELEAVNKTNTAVFTKEQSWKVNFSTAQVKKEPFGQIIKTTAIVEPSQGNEVIVTAKTGGIIKLLSDNLLAGSDVSQGQAMFSISGNEMAENNFTVRYIEARNNFEKARADYERAKELSTDKIVSEKDLAVAKNQYENSKAVYESLNQNFSVSGQTVTSPLNGFIKEIYAKNGAFVEAGQAIMIVSQSKTLVLSANVPQKYAAVLGSIQNANFISPADKTVYTLEELNGKIISYGKSANSDNYLIPVNLQIENNGSFIPGSFVETYLKTLTNSEALTVPNSSLLEEQGNYFVYIQVTPELFEKREVFTGESDGLQTEILKGIAEGERIVTHGAMMIKLAQATGTLDAHSGHVH